MFSIYVILLFSNLVDYGKYGKWLYTSFHSFAVFNGCALKIWFQFYYTVYYYI